MNAISCDRCEAYTMEWKTLSIHNQTDKKYLSARGRIGKWISGDTQGYSKPAPKKTIDLCIPCFKNMEMAIADNVGQVFFKEITPAEEKEV